MSRTASYVPSWLSLSPPLRREFVAVEAVFSGFTYILGSPGTRKLQRLLIEGLSRLAHLIRKPPAGILDKGALDEESWATGAAWTVVVIATPAFCRSVRGRSLMRSRNDFRRNVITLWKRRPKSGEGYLWSSNVELDLPQQLDRESVDKLIEEVSKKIRHLEGFYSTNGVRGPVGRPGLFAMLSYSRKQDELARLVRDRLKQEKVTLWDYGDAPRRQVDYHDELAAKIRDSRVVIILLSDAWFQSKDCQRESKQAADLHKRRLWLRCEDSSPPEDADPADCFDFRPRARKKTLQQLPRLIFPSRRNRRRRT